jgi:hypothetical protein
MIRRAKLAMASSRGRFFGESIISDTRLVHSALGSALVFAGAKRHDLLGAMYIFTGALRLRQDWSSAAIRLAVL